MAFAENQRKLLDGKLPERHVKTRVQRGLTLSYIELARDRRGQPALPARFRKT